MFGQPPERQSSSEDWAEVEAYVGSALPSDFKAFLDLYGTGLVSGELVVFHPRGTAPLLERMRQVNESFGQSRERHPDDYPLPFHPAPGGLISVGYDYSGHEHFLWPSDPDPERWRVVTMEHEVGVRVFEGSFTGFVLAFVKALQDVDEYDGLDPDALEFLEPEDLAELVERGEIGPSKASFEAF